MNAATPAERGREVERVVTEAMKYFDVFENTTNGKYSEKFFVENFKAIGMAQDVFTNACNFIKLTEEKDPAKRIEVSPEVMELLKMMEFHSPKADLAMQKVRMIANANYEYVNFDYLYTASRRELDNVVNYVGSEANEPRVPLAQFDIYLTTMPVVTWTSNSGGINVANKIETDFRKSQQVPKVWALNQHNRLATLDFSKEPGFTNDIATNEGYVIAYTDEQSVCYHMDRYGKATQAQAKDYIES
jgi:hypothetical protein